MNTLYFIPITLLLISLYCLYRLGKSYKSGTVRQEQDKNSPNWGKDITAPGKAINKWALYVAIITFICTVASYWKIHSDYRGTRPGDEKRWEKQKEREQG